jgi:WD40 repeat protein
MSNDKLSPKIKIFNDWKIILIPNNDSICFNIYKLNSKNIYLKTFKLEFLKKLKYFEPNHNIKEIFNYILRIINLKKIELIENGNYLKIIFISINYNNLNIELILDKKVLDDIKRINTINYIIKQEKNTKTQFLNINLEKIKSITAHNDIISSISLFPIGNLVSVSTDKSIKIWDKNLNFIQLIKNAHDDYIYYVNVKDDNFFITCSRDLSIRIWKKKENKFSLFEIIHNAHYDIINKVIFFLNGKFISCSKDKTIKLWEGKNKHQCITMMTHSKSINSILLLNDNNILITSGEDGTKFWNFNSCQCNLYIENAIIYFNGDTLVRLDKDRIIIGGYKIHIFSFEEKKIIKNIDIKFDCYGICVLEDKNIFLVCGSCKDILIFRCDNYENIYIKNNVHDFNITGLIRIRDNLICSYSIDTSIKLWSLNII